MILQVTVPNKNPRGETVGNYSKTLSIKGIDITPPVALAPMVGLSHTAFRTLVKDLGGVGLLYTEMLAAKRLPHDNPQISPLLKTGAKENPLFYQLIAGNVNHIKPAVDKLHQLGAQGIDLNLGCPAPMQKRQGAGASLAENRPELVKMLRTIRQQSDVPLSVKIRLGSRLDDGALQDFAGLLEDEGVDLINIHARLRGEKFCRKPKWHAIAAAKKRVCIPVVANGGIFSVDDARRCMEVSGADGLMIGRGAVQRPWLCCEIAEAIFGVKGNCVDIDKEKIYYDYISLLEHRFQTERRVGRLKQFTHYFAKNFKFGHQLASVVQASSTIEEAREKAEMFFYRLRGREEL